VPDEDRNQRKRYGYGDVAARARRKGSKRPVVSTARQVSSEEFVRKHSDQQPLLEQSDGPAAMSTRPSITSRTSLPFTSVELPGYHSEGQMAIEHLAPFPVAPEYSLYTFYHLSWGTRLPRLRSDRRHLRTAHEEQTTFSSGLQLPDIMGYTEFEGPALLDAEDEQGLCAWYRYEIQFGLRETGTMYIV
jgi:hypothetical protein